eukprot:3982720-Ditylum_brightwellii.AAC.1
MDANFYGTQCKSTDKIFAPLFSVATFKSKKIKYKQNCIKFGIGSGADFHSTSINKYGAKGTLSYVCQDEGVVFDMNVLYSPIENEVSTSLEEHFPDLFSKNILLEVYGLGKVSSGALS